MNILGFEIIRKKDRDDNPFGRVMYNIQIREKGLTLSNPDGTSVPKIGIEVDPRAWLLGHVEAEKFSHDWENISGMPDNKVMEWLLKKNEYVVAGITNPTTKALEDIMPTKKSDDGGMYR